MRTIEISTDGDLKGLRSLLVGDVVTILGGRYRTPIVIDGATGTRDRPIIIRALQPKSGGDAPTFCGSMSFAQARRWANEKAAQREKAGHYPAIGYLGDQAILTLRNCQFVVIDGIHFDSCWPTAIYLDRSQHIVINDVHFRSGTIAIGANGIETRDIVVQHCTWQQDLSGSDMWNRVPWSRVHGASNNSASGHVDLEDDYRLWDGDFFRGWNVGGNIVIRHNQISDAFNGIHFFNTFDRLAPGVEASSLEFNGGRQSTSNILIEHNRFTRIRDNVFEPEYHAWNWVIRHNHLYDCYRPFSFEFARAGYFYVYGNTAAFVSKPAKDVSDKDKKELKGKLRRNPSLFKPRGTQRNEGELYVFNNSWHMGVGKGIYPKFALGKLVSVNNAMQFGDPAKARMFGSDGAKKSSDPNNIDAELKDEEGRFTRRWHTGCRTPGNIPGYSIRIYGELGNDDNFPDVYESRGYELGPQCIPKSPQFANPNSALTPDFTPQLKAAFNSALPLTLNLPNGQQISLSGGHDRGAVQRFGFFDRLDSKFGFLPEVEWADDALLEKQPSPQSLPKETSSSPPVRQVDFSVFSEKRNRTSSRLLLRWPRSCCSPSWYFASSMS